MTIQDVAWEDGYNQGKGDATEAKAEIERLRRSNESLRRQRRKLINGLLPLAAECPTPGGCGNCTLCHRDVARALVDNYSKNLHAAGVDMSPHGVRLLAQRADRAEATLDRVRALADEWDEHLDRSQCPSCLSMADCDHGEGYHHALSNLRAILDAPQPEAGGGSIDAAHIEHQRRWSTNTFGPGLRLGVIDHLRKELEEVEEDPNDLGEWVDVIILGLDGAWRAGHEPQAIIDAIKAKQARNEDRTWPDWRTADRDKAIEHDRSIAEAGGDDEPNGLHSPHCNPGCFGFTHYLGSGEEEHLHHADQREVCEACTDPVPEAGGDDE